jgi:hypothetical protein
MRTAFVVWLLCLAGGMALLVLPVGEGRRLIAFSEEHGPSLTDAAGALLLVVGWLVLLVQGWTRRGRLARLPPAVGALGWFLFGTGWGLVVASVFSDFAWWWVVGVALLVAVQMVALVAVMR